MDGVPRFRAGARGARVAMTILPRIAFVVAVARNGVIGRDGSLPWKISADLKKFKAVTTGKPVVMGRKTWESLPRRPLPGRDNIVLTRQVHYSAPGATVVRSLDEALQRAAQSAHEEVAVIGGGEVFRELLGRADRIYLSEVGLDVGGDTYFPVLDRRQWQESGRETYPGAEGENAGFIFSILDRRP